MLVGYDEQPLKVKTHRLFGEQVRIEQPLAMSGMGVRFEGIDLCMPLSPEQVKFLVDVLSRCRLLCVAGQDLERFSLAHFERFANHWGAPIPHPSNFTRGGKPAQQDGATGGAIEFVPYETRKVALADRTLPGQINCLPHDSPAVLIASNCLGPSNDEPRTEGGKSWHTDVEYEPLPIYVSMFLAHLVPTSREPDSDNWVSEPQNGRWPNPYFDGSDKELMQLRTALPLNGETAFADTAAAFAALPADEQAALMETRVRRRLNAEDEGWLAPLVRTDPRSVWASRPGVRPAIEVDGLSIEASRTFLDRLEKHVLQPDFRYDHCHVAGDVTIWHNYMTLHNSPPIKTNIRSVNDARLLYRLSCKGDPALSLPRDDDPSWLGAHVVGSYTTPSEILDVT